MRLNRSVPSTPAPRTHEGAVAHRISPEAQLKRTVLACLLWEDTFYESGVEIAQRIVDLAGKCNPAFVQQLAYNARKDYNLRHAPLQLVMAMLELGKTNPDWRVGLSHVIADVCQRADEPAELLAMYWAKKKRPLSAQLKKGLAKAMLKFNAFQLAKYNQDNKVKLRDVMFLSHPNPGEARETFKQLATNTLPTPNTWEVRLTECHTAAEKKAVWEELLRENQLGALALIRNLRNMLKAGVSEMLVRKALREMKTERVLPYRFITSVRYAPQFKPELEQAMYRNLQDSEPFKGSTVILVDVSGSMDVALSSKSEMLRWEAAAGLAILARELCENVRIFTFSYSAVEVPNLRGFDLIEGIKRSQTHGGTNLGAALGQIPSSDRLIVITDEQSADEVRIFNGGINYCINVAPYKNGVSYGGNWVHIDGFSDATLRYIAEFERQSF
jgi:60 kDa SS-A/Ro ribonucleoprotein